MEKSNKLIMYLKSLLIKNEIRVLLNTVNSNLYLTVRKKWAGRAIIKDTFTDNLINKVYGITRIYGGCE